MLGIRQHNYRAVFRSAAYPSYESFLQAKDWNDIDSQVRTQMQSSCEWDPIYHPTSNMRRPFANLDQVQQNYSQSWQDIFVLTMLNGKQQGTFLELGAGDPVYMNNTYLLTDKFGWSGLSIDFRSELTDLWQQHRPKDDFRCINAWHTDFEQLLADLPMQIDYLQVDLDETASLSILKKLPHDSKRFSVITFETDVFAGHQHIQQQSRQFLQDLGYQLLIDNVAVRNYSTGTWEPFEDWYIDPLAVPESVAHTFACVNNTTKLPHRIFTTEEDPHGHF